MAVYCLGGLGLGCWDFRGWQGSRVSGLADFRGFEGFEGFRVHVLGFRTWGWQIQFK